MPKTAQARKNMLDCQLATNGILSPEILDAFGKVPREMFIPDSYRGAAYLDEDIILPNGAIFMEPLIHARMVQATAPETGDAVLNISDTTGYSSAILSNLVSTVVTLESRIGILDRARKAWDELNFCNVAVVKGKEVNGNPEHAPYNIIFINGAVESIPDGLVSQLADKGRLVAVVRDRDSAVGCITVVQKIADGQYSTRKVADASTPFAPGFEPQTPFVF